MARPLSVEFPGAVYHTTARGNACQAIVADDDERRRFVGLLGREVSQQRWACYAWCLTDNHYHLLIETPEGNLVSRMRRLNQTYTQSFNRRHKQVGHLLQGRYKRIVVDKESYLLELCRYVVLNPVRAKMVRTARDWRWNSFRATANLVKTPLAYRQFVRQGIKASSPWDSLRGQIWLGSDEFRERMAPRVADQNLDAVPNAQTRPDRATPEEALDAVATAFGVERKQVLSRAHQAAFQAAVLLLRRACNLPLKEVSAMAGISPSRVSKIQSHIERAKPSGPTTTLLDRCKVKHPRIFLCHWTRLEVLLGDMIGYRIRMGGQNCAQMARKHCLDLAGILSRCSPTASRKGAVTPV